MEWYTKSELKEEVEANLFWKEIEEEKQKIAERHKQILKEALVPWFERR